MSWINQLLAWIYGYFQYFFKVLQAYFIWVWDYLVRQITGLIEYVTGKALEIDSVLEFPAVASLLDFYAAADQWFPLTELLILVQLYFAVYSLLIVIRWTLKLLPMLGGH